MNPTQEQFEAMQQELNDVKEELKAVKQELECTYYMYKQFKGTLLGFCNENNGGSDFDNFSNMVDTTTRSNNIDKKINTTENVDNWVETNYWDCLINDKENSTFPLAKEDMLDESDNLFNAKLFDGENVRHYELDGSYDSDESYDDIMRGVS